MICISMYHHTVFYAFLYDMYSFCVDACSWQDIGAHIVKLEPSLNELKNSMDKPDMSEKKINSTIRLHNRSAR